MNLILRFPTLRSLRMTGVNLGQNTLQRSLNGFKAITVLEIVFVRVPTCGYLLDILVATPLLESVMLTEIYWTGIGNIPSPQSFRYLHNLRTHCEGNSQILGWLCEGSLPALSRLSIRARSVPRGEFLHTLGTSLEHLLVKMSVKPYHDRRNESQSFDFVARGSAPDI